MSINREVAESIGKLDGAWGIRLVKDGVESGASAGPYDPPWTYGQACDKARIYGEFWQPESLDFFPDTDLNAAMEAMSKLCRDSKDKILECGLEYELTGDGWRYFAYIREAGIGINDFYAEGDTPALAICHAILEASRKNAGK